MDSKNILITLIFPVVPTAFIQGTPAGQKLAKKLGELVEASGWKLGQLKVSSWAVCVSFEKVTMHLPSQTADVIHCLISEIGQIPSSHSVTVF